MGFPGIPGSNGMPGMPGVPGPQGPQGRDGTKGQIGDKGSQGMLGPRGDRGREGPPGKSGPRGIKGIKGEQGLVGMKGQRGIAVNQGQNGDKGEKGESAKASQTSVALQTNWKQCVWNSHTGTNNGKIKVIRIRIIHNTLQIKFNHFKSKYFSEERRLPSHLRLPTRYIYIKNQVTFPSASVLFERKKKIKTIVSDKMTPGHLDIRTPQI